VEQLEISTTSRSQLLDVTARLASVVTKSGLKRGVVVAYVPHTTAGITINESADPSVPRDMLDAFARLAPPDLPYRHREGNADAHIMAALLGGSVTIPVEDGRLQLGTWQGVFFAELDGPRRRHLWVQLVAAS
jgi:secondary thiamine-phosphate synthase enzyme